jgi:hypothetical protein
MMSGVRRRQSAVRTRHAARAYDRKPMIRHTLLFARALLLEQILHQDGLTDAAVAELFTWLEQVDVGLEATKGGAMSDYRIVQAVDTARMFIDIYRPEKP